MQQADPYRRLYDIWDYWAQDVFLVYESRSYVFPLKNLDKPRPQFKTKARVIREIELYLDYWGCLDAPLP
jgi:hypothetical protein